MKRQLAMLLMLTFGFTSCTMAKISGRGGLPILFNNLPAKVEVLRHVEEQRRIVFDYTSAFDSGDVLSPLFIGTKADAFVNATFVVKKRFSDYLINMITFGAANSWTLLITGDLVKTPQGLGALDISDGTIAESKRLEDLNLTPSIGAPTSGTAPLMIVHTPSGEYALMHHDAGQPGVVEGGTAP